MRVVTVRRWEVVGSFVAIIIGFYAVSAWNTHKIHEAEKRIEHNTQVNHAQDVTRAILLHALERTDRRACERIEVLKKQNRIDAINQFARLDQTLHLLHLRKTPQIVAEARRQLRHTLARNAPSAC